MLYNCSCYLYYSQLLHKEIGPELKHVNNVTFLLNGVTRKHWSNTTFNPVNNYRISILIYEQAKKLEYKHPGG